MTRFVGRERHALVEDLLSTYLRLRERSEPMAQVRTIVAPAGEGNIADHAVSLWSAEHGDGIESFLFEQKGAWLHQMSGDADGARQRLRSTRARAEALLSADHWFVIELDRDLRSDALQVGDDRGEAR